MLEKEFHISKLIASRLKGQLTAAEETELEEWLSSSSKYRELLEDLEDEQLVSEKLYSYRSVNKTVIWTKTVGGLQKETSPVKPRRKFKLLVFVSAVAAAVALMTLSIYFYNTSQDSKNIRRPEFIAGTKDITSGKDGATLTLANGRQIIIKHALVGNIASEAGVKISKTADGQLVYEIAGNDVSPVAYNTLSTTRGQQTQLHLPDGTLVYLNAASSLRYPTSFAKSTIREVSLTGEGYFEVAAAYRSFNGRRIKQSFVVKSQRQQVEVLGTHFNINSYGDDRTIRTTLIEGLVRVSSGNQTQVLKPGQQGVLSEAELKVEPADIQTAVAWKNNEFMFESEPIQNIMKLVERWYDVEIVYEGAVPDYKFNGAVSRFGNVSKVLQILESTKKVHFKIEGRRITVSK